METNLESKMTVLMLEVDRMKNGKEEIQSQFELLYRKISQLKEEFDSSSSYDSSGHNTDSESNSDYEFHFEKVNNETVTKDTTLIHNENSLKNFVNTEEKSNFTATNDDSFDSIERQEETDDDSACSSDNVAPVDVLENAHIEHLFSTTSIPTKLEDSELKENGHESKVHAHDHKDIICHGNDSSKATDWDAIEIEAEENTTMQKAFKKAEHPSSAIQNMFVSTPHNTNSTEIAKNESDTSTIDTNATELIPTTCTTKHYLHKTRLFMFNIQPRRRLHQLAAVRNEETEELGSERLNQKENPVESVTEDLVHDISDNSSVIAMTTENFTSKTSDGADISYTEESMEASAFTFISVEDGFISFCVKSNNYCPDKSNDSDASSSDDSETDLDFLDVQDGYITFKAISEAYNSNTLCKDFYYIEDDDIFIDEETYGIEALFNRALSVSDSKTKNVIEDSVDIDDTYLEGLTQMFDEVDCTKKENEAQNQDDKKNTDQLDTNVVAVCDAMSSGSEHETEGAVKESADSCSAKAKSNQTELRSRSSEYSFAGVMLLNALPSVLTSSLLSVFSNPAFGFAFYKPVPLTSCSGLTSSDFAKLSFSSHELPFKKLTGLSFGDNESQFETLSTCSTSSKESSRTESVCES